MGVVGLDIGGANLKASDGETSWSIPFPMWRKYKELAGEIQSLLERFHPFGPIAVTMTGELADCFETRTDGVHTILDAVVKAAGKREVAVWQTGGEFISVAEAKEFPMLAAAANWHALATWAGRCRPKGQTILFDIGSTTMDVISIIDGFASSEGVTDFERLKAGELVYLGSRRTPVPMILNSVVFDGKKVPLANENFATMLDVQLVLNRVPSTEMDCDTADGKPATRKDALRRLARCVCSDLNELGEACVMELASQVNDAFQAQLAEGARRVLDRAGSFDTVILSGEGVSLVASMIDNYLPQLAGSEILSLSKILGKSHSDCACAFAVARLGSERL